MNKNKKIAFAVVSSVLAGTLAFSATACTPGGADDDAPLGPYSGTVGTTIDTAKANKVANDLNTTHKLSARTTAFTNAWGTAKSYWDYLKTASAGSVADGYGVLNADGSIKYSTYTSRSKVTLNLGIGNNNTQTSTAFHELGDEITLPDGTKYKDGNFKPAWVQLGKDLNITFNDVYVGSPTNSNIKDMKEKSKFSETDLFTTDLSLAAAEAVETQGSVLNLGEYLNCMPNFNKFLQANPIVYLSLLQSGMETSGDNAGKGKVIYVAPYFDGNDDIERYCIIRQDWADKLLNGNDTLAEPGAQFGKTSDVIAVNSYMGKTGKVTIESLNSDGTGKVNIVKNYSAALAAAKNEETDLGKAYKEIAGEVYAGDSGNIVDIMNAALKANFGARGAQLANLVRGYIDACYQKEDGTAYYSAANRSNLFNGYDACWDVDDLVAILRCVRTNAKNLTNTDTIEGIVPRAGTNDRTPDMVRLAGQLYGVRGVDSRFEYTYIDKDGNIKDARADKELYEALANMHTLKQENLIADYSGLGDFNYASAKNNKGEGEAFMMYDYSQTQTKEGFGYEDKEGSTYNLAAVINPVAKWTVNTADDTTMRFTESWRSTKTSGLALNGSLAKSGNEAKLAAALQLVDYLYSEDGQIVSTYGPMASDANGTGGFWYNEPLADQNETDTSKYFTYKGTKYSGTSYKGKITPTITTSLYNSFKGKEVNGWKLEDNKKVTKAKTSFTDYARYLLGTTLPVGVKDQSFENQLTAKIGQAGAGKVGVALANGVVKGMTLDIKDNNWWYTCVPTGLPFSSDVTKNVLNSSDQDNLKYMTGTQKKDKNFVSIFNYIILNGFTGTYNQQDVQYEF